MQICTWLPENSGFEGGEEVPDDRSSRGEWLYCLRDTQPGDRQLVWSGVKGRGIIAVVDFSGEVRPRHEREGRYEGWGAVTSLRDPIAVSTVQSHPVLKPRFTGNGLRALLGPVRLTADLASAIDDLAGGVPEPTPPGPVDWQALGGDWGRRSLPREKVAELIVLDKDRIARKIGFPGDVEVNPGGHKKTLGNEKQPDLWCERGVVGEVKNQITASWGRGQLEG